MTNRISIAEDFSPVPAGRSVEDGPRSGEKFREECLVPQLRKAQDENSTLEIVLDGVEGLSSSFLEEGFGGLVRHGHFHAHEIKKILTVKASSSDYKLFIDAIWTYIDEAEYGQDSSP